MISKLALGLALLSPVLLSPAYARGGGHGGGGGHAGGGGSRGGAVSSFRGGSGGNAVRGGAVGGGVYRGAPGAFRGAPYYYGGRYYRGPSVYLGLGYPYYYGYYSYPYYYGYDPYYYGYDSSYGYQAPPPDAGYGYPYPPYPQPPPPPQTQPQAGAGTSQADNYYLIAFKDHTIEPATSYKIDGDQIHWITLEGREKQGPLSSLDVPLTQQLNRDRAIDFHIP